MDVKTLASLKERQAANGKWAVGETCTRSAAAATAAAYLLQELRLCKPIAAMSNEHLSGK